VLSEHCRVRYMYNYFTHTHTHTHMHTYTPMHTKEIIVCAISYKYVTVCVCVCLCVPPLSYTLSTLTLSPHIAHTTPPHTHPVHVLMCSDHNLVIQIWDTAGQERFFALVKMYYRNVVGAFLIFDCCRR